MSLYRITHLPTGRTTQGTPGEVHPVLVGWFVDMPLADLQAVDGLARALETGSYDLHRLAVRLGLDVDLLGEPPDTSN